MERDARPSLGKEEPIWLSPEGAVIRPQCAVSWFICISLFIIVYTKASLVVSLLS